MLSIFGILPCGIFNNCNHLLEPLPLAKYLASVVPFDEEGKDGFLLVGGSSGNEIMVYAPNHFPFKKVDAQTV
jgi:hypothetical protein